MVSVAGLSFDVWISFKVFVECSLSWVAAGSVVYAQSHSYCKLNGKASNVIAMHIGMSTCELHRCFSLYINIDHF